MIEANKIERAAQIRYIQPSRWGYTNTHADSQSQFGPSEPKQPTVAVGDMTIAGSREIDQELVLRAQRGDKRAFGLLVDKYQRKLARLVSRMVRDQSEIEDVVQEAFIKAYRALPNFRGDSAFYTWLYRIGINSAKNHLIALGRRPTVSTDIEIEDAEHFESGDELRTIDTPESSMMTKEIAKTVNDTVADLPAELREAITLREIEGLSYEEIATIMNCPIGTVRSRIFRAREAIAQKLRPLLDTPENKRW
ncbi:MAG: RNA polymerase sigma factor RpoE [Betaproteobacteria bacterium]|nr:RNA polymerase sigma factor RpoE [Betaproteobacteria bacterium]